MISPYPFRAADTDSLSSLRTGGRCIGARLMRQIARAGGPKLMLERAKDALHELIEDVAAVARDDASPATPREKAAEFIVNLGARQVAPRSVVEVVDRVGEAAARARYRGAPIVDFLSTWLYVAGEQFIGSVEHALTAAELESVHDEVWSRFRASLLEVLEAGAERLTQGRRFRVAEIYLARFRAVRARNEEQRRAPGLAIGETNALTDDVAAIGDEHDFVAAVAVDLFALSLGDVEQRLIVGQIPGPSLARGKPGFDGDLQRRLWSPLRAIKNDQSFERWPKLVKGLGLSDRQAFGTLLHAIATHLQKTWEWFFPEQRPFGTVRAELKRLETAMRAELPEAIAQEVVDRHIQSWTETLSFMVRLAGEDAEHALSSLKLDEDDGPGVF